MLLLTEVLFPWLTVLFCLEAGLCEARLPGMSRNPAQGHSQLRGGRRIRTLGPGVANTRRALSLLRSFLMDEGRQPTGALR